MDDPAFLPTADTTVDLNTQTILLHASNHDLPALKPLLRIPGNASLQDPETGFTPLHAAIAACGPAKPFSTQTNGDTTTTEEGKPGEEKPEDGDEDGDPEKAKEVVRELFLGGAIWNDLDANNETPGCLAWRLGQMELYELCVDAGVRAELLLGLMGSYEPLADSDSEDEDEDEQVPGTNGENKDSSTTNGEDAKATKTNGETNDTMEGTIETSTSTSNPDVTSETYLSSTLTFTPSALLDSSSNGIMMSWESAIMRRSVDLLLPPPHSGKRILNIGFGMGIIDRMFRDTKPLSHHIVEAHPGVIARLADPESGFGRAWEEAAPVGGRYKIHAGKWQDVVPKLLEDGEVFDAIYFDTFGEDYSQLKLFFTEYVPGLLDPSGRFSFFNGLGADRRICYDVYCKVAEFDLCDAGMDVEWTSVDVPLTEMGMEKDGEGEWKGVRRRYWTLDKYRLPICTFLG